MKIAVYAIAKNERQFVDRFLRSAADADYILVADTGSTDGTEQLVAQWPHAQDQKPRADVRMAAIAITPWRFDHARNAALALLPADIDVCVSLDMDEVLEPGWRDEIERVWELGKTTRLRYGFDWGQGIRFQYEKIHARSGYRWHHPCHEYPVPDARIREVYAHTDKLLVRHLPDATKSRGQYLDLLKLSVTEDPRCPRNAFYYARELTFHARWGDALHELHRYLQLPGADWPNERCYAMRLVAKCHEELGRGDAAHQWLMRACAEAPGTREPWCDLAMWCYRRSKWAQCYSAATAALQIEHRELVYTCDPAVWGPLPHDLAAIAAWHLGMREVASQHGGDAVAQDPQDARLRANLMFYMQE